MTKEEIESKISEARMLIYCEECRDRHVDYKFIDEKRQEIYELTKLLESL